MRYQVIGKSGKVYGTFATKPLAYQFINNTYPSYKSRVKSDGNLREILNETVLPDIMSVVSVKKLVSKQTKKTEWERLVELTEATNPDENEINRLRSKLLNKSMGNDKLDWDTKKGRNSGQPVFAKMPNGNLLSFSTYTQAGDYFGVAASSISARVYEGTVTRTGKIKGISFYIEE